VLYFKSIDSNKGKRKLRGPRNRKIRNGTKTAVHHRDNVFSSRATFIRCSERRETSSAGISGTQPSPVKWNVDVARWNRVRVPRLIPATTLVACVHTRTHLNAVIVFGRPPVHVLFLRGEATGDFSGAYDSCYSQYTHVCVYIRWVSL